MRSFREHQIYQLSESLKTCDVQEGIDAQLEILRLQLIEASKLPKLVMENMNEQSEWNLAVEQDHQIQRYIIDNTIRFAKEHLYEVLIETKVDSFDDLHQSLMKQVGKMLKTVVHPTIQSGATASRGSSSSPSGGGAEMDDFVPSAPQNTSRSRPQTSSSGSGGWRDELDRDRPEVDGYKPAPLGSFLPAAKSPGESWWKRLGGGLKRSIVDPIMNWGPIKKFRQNWHRDQGRPMTKEARLQFNAMLLENEMLMEDAIEDAMVKFDAFLKSNLGHLAKIMGVPYAGKTHELGAAPDQEVETPQAEVPNKELSDDEHLPMGTPADVSADSDVTSTGEDEEDVVDPEQTTELERRAASGDPEAKREVLEAYQKFKKGAARLGMEAKVKSSWGRGKTPKFARSQLFVNGQPIQGSAAQIGRMVYEKIYTDILGLGEPPQTKQISAKVRHKVNDYLGLHGRAGTFPQITAAIMRLGELGDGPSVTPSQPEPSQEIEDIETSNDSELDVTRTNQDQNTAQDVAANTVQEKDDVSNVISQLKANNIYDEFAKFAKENDAELNDELIKDFGGPDEFLTWAKETFSSEGSEATQDVTNDQEVTDTQNVVDENEDLVSDVIEWLQANNKKDFDANFVEPNGGIDGLKDKIRQAIQEKGSEADAKQIASVIEKGAQGLKVAQELDKNLGSDYNARDVVSKIDNWKKSIEAGNLTDVIDELVDFLGDDDEAYRVAQDIEDDFKDGNKNRALNTLRKAVGDKMAARRNNTADDNDMSDFADDIGEDDDELQNLIRSQQAEDGGFEADDEVSDLGALKSIVRKQLANKIDSDLELEDISQEMDEIEDAESLAEFLDGKGFGDLYQKALRKLSSKREWTVQETIDFYKTNLKNKKPNQNRIQQLREQLLGS